MVICLDKKIIIIIVVIIFMEVIKILYINIYIYSVCIILHMGNVSNQMIKHHYLHNQKHDKLLHLHL